MWHFTPGEVRRVKSLQGLQSRSGGKRNVENVTGILWHCTLWACLKGFKTPAEKRKRQLPIWVSCTRRHATPLSSPPLQRCKHGNKFKARWHDTVLSLARIIWIYFKCKWFCQVFWDGAKSRFPSVLCVLFALCVFFKQFWQKRKLKTPFWHFLRVIVFAGAGITNQTKLSALDQRGELNGFIHTHCRFNSKPSLLGKATLFNFYYTDSLNKFCSLMKWHSQGVLWQGLELRGFAWFAFFKRNTNNRRHSELLQLFFFFAS